MLYDYQYTIAGLLATLVLLLVSLQRRGYLYSKSNQIYFSLIYCNLISGCFDLTTFWTISYPQSYSLVYDYATNISYLIFYSILAATFFRYIAALTGGKTIQKTTRCLYLAAVIIQTLLLLTTPLTHWIIYFDGNLVYRHGPLMWLIYAIPYGLLFAAFWFVLRNKDRFNHLQIQIMAILYVLMLSYSMVQLRFKKIDLGCLAFALILFIIYMIFENPAYYNYRQTKCLNHRAFHQEAERLSQQDKNKVRLYLIVLTNRPDTESIHAKYLMEELQLAAANRLSRVFGSCAYCVDKFRFALIFKNSDHRLETDILAKIDTALQTPVTFGGEKAAISYQVRGVDFASLAISDDFVDHLVESIQQSPVNELFSDGDISEILLEQHRYRLIEDAVLEAVEKDLFEVVYQPIYSLEKKDFHSVEALIRLNDRRLGAIPPMRFIPIAEKNGSILGVGECVFRKVCDFIAGHPLRDLGIRYIEVNFSMVQLMQPELAEHYIHIMHAYGVSPEEINIEVTESVELGSDPVVHENIRIFTEAGIRFSIDDFGSGFSTSGYLFRLPFDLVKIDKSLLWSAFIDEAAMTILQQTMALVHALGKQIVVEGVEDQSMVDLVAANKGEYLQGFFYSKPLSETDFLSFLKMC